MFEGEYKVISDEYINNKTEMNVEHICGFQYPAKPVHFLRKERNCPVCTPGSKMINTSVIKEKVKRLTNSEYEVTGEYTGRKKPIKIKHKTCDLEHEYASADDFLGTTNRIGRRCPYCHGHNRMIDKTFINNILIKDFNGDYELIGVYNSHSEEITLKHKECGEPFNIIANKLWEKNKRTNICKYCHGHNKFRDKEALIKQLKLRFPDFDKEIIGDYSGTHDKLKVKHLKCDKTYYVSPTNLLSGKDCPYCANVGGHSKMEIELIDFLKTILPNIDVIQSERNVLKNNKELDIYIPSKQLAIEFNGLYWHSETNGKDKKYHLSKLEECIEKGINLIQIFEDEWINSREIVELKLQHLLKVNTKKKVYARNCYVEEINNEYKNEFLERNHIQGKDNSSIKLGLWLNKENGDELIAVMTFCKPRLSLGQKENKFDYELSRFATDLDYRTIGAFSKLFNYFKLNYDFNNIITYADRRWSMGNVYDKNEFKFSHISEPNYWYFKNGNKRYHRFNFRKQNLEKLFPDIYDKSKTEKQIMEEANYNIIWDCGNLVYIYSNEK